MTKKLYCPECDNEVLEGEKFCSQCGYEFRDDIKVEDNKKKLSAPGIVLIVLIAALVILIIYLFLNPGNKTETYKKLYNEGKLNDVAEQGVLFLESNETNEKVWELVIAANYRTGDKEKAQELINEFVKKDIKNGENTTVVVTLGNLSFDDGDFKTAIEAYDNSLIKLSNYDKPYATESAQKYIRSYIILGDYEGGLNKIDELSRILGADKFTSVKNELIQAKLKHENNNDKPKEIIEKPEVEEKPQEPKIEEREVVIAPIVEDKTITVHGKEVFRENEFVSDNDNILVPLKGVLKELQDGLDPNVDVDMLEIFILTDDGLNVVNIDKYDDELKEGDKFIIGFVRDSGIVSGEFTIGSNIYKDKSPDGIEIDIDYEMKNKILLHNGDIYMGPADINEFIYPITYKMDGKTLIIESNY